LLGKNEGLSSNPRLTKRKKIKKKKRRAEKGFITEPGTHYGKRQSKYSAHLQLSLECR
jgi:hypothetical protein